MGFSYVAEFQMEPFGVKIYFDLYDLTWYDIISWILSIQYMIYCISYIVYEYDVNFIPTVSSTCHTKTLSTNKCKKHKMSKLCLNNLLYMQHMFWLIEASWMRKYANFNFQKFYAFYTYSIIPPSSGMPEPKPEVLRW